MISNHHFTDNFHIDATDNKTVQDLHCHTYNYP